MTSIVRDISERGWSLAPEWLSGEELAVVGRAFDRWQREKRFAPAKIGQGQNLQQQTAIRGDETWWFDLADPPAELQAVLARVAALKQQLNRELFLGLKDWEVHLASYPPGACYRKHLDRHHVSSRKLSLIVYLNESWQPANGGELVLYNREGLELSRVTPYGGTLVAFLSEDFPHEVLPATRERRSLTGWFLDAPKGVL